MSTERGGTIITTLPISEETKNRRKDVNVDFTLVYTELGYEINFANAFPFPAMHEDKVRTHEYNVKDVQRVLEGWKAGSGAPKFKTQKLRLLPGGLAGIAEGLKIMQDGAYGREKLVYKLG